MLFVTLVAAAASRILRVPRSTPLLFESFSDNKWRDTWKISSVQNVTGKWRVKETSPPQGVSGEKMIFTDKGNSYYGLSRTLDEPIEIGSKTFIIQYEARFLENVDCAGAYIKLFGQENFSPENLCNETKYVVMFGPDKCADTNKVHFIFRNRDARGVREEKHMKDAPTVRQDKLTHLYTLIIRKDYTFEVMIDGVSERNGSLLNDFEPSVIPPKMIDDPEDVKPADWVDEAEIPDPNARKPADWPDNEPEYIPDPTQLTAPEGWLFDEPPEIPDTDLSPPSDWDESVMGPWEPPMIDNPKCDDAPGCGEYHPPMIKNEKYKGKWEPPMIPNPAYKGPFTPRQIPNPDYSPDVVPQLDPIVGVGFELWMVDRDVGFGNVYIGNDEVALRQWNEDHFIPKKRRQDRLHEDEEERQAKEMEQEAADRQAEAGDADPESEFDEEPGKLHENYQDALKDFAFAVQDAWLELYHEDETMTQVITAAVVLLPFVIFFYSCCRCSPRLSEAERRERAEKRKAHLEALAKKRAEFLFKKWLQENPDPNAPPEPEPQAEEDEEEDE